MGRTYNMKAGTKKCILNVGGKCITSSEMGMCVCAEVANSPSYKESIRKI
jgi:hypothetical protein